MMVQKKISNRPEKIRAIFPYTSEKKFRVSYELPKYYVRERMWMLVGS